MTKKQITITSYIINVAVLALVYIVLSSCISTGIISKYISGILILVCINILLATSLNITTGCLGQIALGHAGFMSVGAYTAAIFTKAELIPGLAGYIVALILGGVVAAMIGIVIGIPALRLRGDYLAIITLAFGEIIRVIIEYLSVTGGAQGLRGIPKISSFSRVYTIMVISIVLMWTLMRSRHGRAILAIREDDVASDASGINNTFYRTLAFTVSAFFAGIAGGMYAHHIGILGAKAFGFNRSIEILVIVVLGGLGSFTGAVVSAIVLTILPEALRQFSDYRMLVYALALIIMMIFRPKGLLGTKEFQITKLIEKFSPKKAEKKGGEAK